MKRYKALIKYEVVSMLKAGYIPGFGIVLPCLLFSLIAPSVVTSVPTAVKNIVTEKIFFSFAMIIPLAIVLIGYASSYSRDCELEIPQRLQLFGIEEKQSFISKIIAQMVVVLVGFFIYLGVGMTVNLTFERPIVILLMVCILFVQAVIEFILAHGIVRLCKKFGLTYLVTMVCYFGFMTVSGFMGVPIESLPKALRFIGQRCLPFASTGDWLIAFSTKEKYDLTGFFVSYGIFFAISLIIIIIAKLRDKRGLKV